MSIPEEVIKIIEAEFEEEIKRIKGPMDGPVKTLAEIEQTVLGIRNRFGQRLMEEAIKYQGAGEISGEKKCPKCQSPLKEKGLVKRILNTLLGKIFLKRLRYECANENCSMNLYPLDERLDISSCSASKGLAKIISLFSIFIPYEHVRKFIKDSLILTVSGTCIKEIGYRSGKKISEQFSNGESEQEENNDFSLLYLQVDGAMTPILTENGLEYKENKLALAFSDQDMMKKVTKKGEERIEIKNRRFASSIGKGVEIFKELTHKLALKKGLLKAKTVVILSDGAAWISKMKDDYFSNALQILDWYHAVEHLWDTAHLLYGDNKKKCTQWVIPLKQKLWDGDIDAVLHAIKQQALNSSKKQQTPLLELHTYYFNNRKNMNYADYRTKGYYIGSTAIESANKYIVSQRLKQAGMRRQLDRANAMIWLRCKYFEGIWDRFWEGISLREMLAKPTAA